MTQEAWVSQEMTEANRQLKHLGISLEDLLGKDGLETEARGWWATILLCVGEWCRNNRASPSGTVLLGGLH